MTEGLYLRLEAQLHSIPHRCMEKLLEKNVRKWDRRRNRRVALTRGIHVRCVDVGRPEGAAKARS